MTGPTEDIKIHVQPPEDPLAVYAEWCEQRDVNLKEGSICVPIPVAELYLVRLMCAFRGIPHHVIDIDGTERN